MSDQNNEPVAMVCNSCGSIDVYRDAYASWDVKAQQWVLANVYDDTFCNHCEAERSLDEMPIEEVQS